MLAHVCSSTQNDQFFVCLFISLVVNTCPCAIVSSLGKQALCFELCMFMHEANIQFNLKLCKLWELMQL